MTALLRKLRSQANPDCPIRYRSLAFPSAADLFDVQSSFNHMIVNNIQLNKFVELTVNKRDAPIPPRGISF